MAYKFSIFLSASVPTEERSAEFEKIPDAQIQIEQAVIALSRNVFQEGGRLIFGGHPSISPLVATVAKEYDFDVRNPDKPIHIYQSKAYSEVTASQTTNLSELGYAKIIPIEAVDEEKFNPEIKDRPQCEKSLTFMRERMLSENPDAMVCIGGMKGVIDEFKLFRRFHPNKPVYILATTGGASRNLAREYPDFVADKPNAANIENHRDSQSKPIKIIPYTFLTASIVRKVLKKNHQ